MTLRATYDRSSDKWTQGYDRALSYLSDYIIGDVLLSTKLSPTAPNGYLGYNSSGGFVPLGKYKEKDVFLPQAAARLQGYNASSEFPDLYTSYNGQYPYSFGGPQPNTYSFDDLMIYCHDYINGL